MDNSGCARLIFSGFVAFLMSVVYLTAEVFNTLVPFLTTYPELRMVGICFLTSAILATASGIGFGILTEDDDATKLMTLFMFPMLFLGSAVSTLVVSSYRTDQVLLSAPGLEKAWAIMPPDFAIVIALILFVVTFFVMYLISTLATICE